jgi:hypothetical protein
MAYSPRPPRSGLGSEFSLLSHRTSTALAVLFTYILTPLFVPEISVKHIGG